MTALLKVELELNSQLKILNSGVILRYWDRLKDGIIAVAAAVML